MAPLTSAAAGQFGILVGETILREVKRNARLREACLGR